MGLKFRFTKQQVDVPNRWIDREAFFSITQTEMIELIHEDIQAFLDDIKFNDNIEFYWED